LFQQALHNFCRPLIYSTAPSPLLIAGVRLAHERYARIGAARRQALALNVKTYLAARSNISDFSAQAGPIQWFASGSGGLQLHEMVARARDAGFAVYGIQAPTVPEGAERIRICLHSFNAASDIEALCAYFK
jgi:8-amino-7-oxononanoate synthase